MREYILHLLQKQKTIAIDDLLKKTNLEREVLTHIIFNLSRQDKVYYINIDFAQCLRCKAKNYCKKGRKKWFT